MPVTNDCLIFELISRSLGLPFLKNLTLLFSQTINSTFEVLFWLFHMFYALLLNPSPWLRVVLGRVEVCALVDLGRYESASPWMKTAQLRGDPWDVFIPPAIV